MGWLIKQIFNFSLNHFHKWYGLVCSVLLTWILLLSVYKLLPSNNWSEYYLVGISLVSFIFIIYWITYTQFLPKRKKNRIGVVISVHVESKEDYVLFKNDFLKPFKEQLGELNRLFQIIPLKNFQSENISCEDDVRVILKKTKSQFIVWGSVKKRKKDNQYFFDLRAMVVHSPIDEIRKIVLVNDFNALLPNKITFESNFQPEAFEFRSNQLYVAVEYITGRAALLSGDPKIALQLHESLYKKIKEGFVCPVSHRKLSKIISLEHAILADKEFIDSDQKISETFIKHVATSLEYDSENYSSLLKQAIVDFNQGGGDAKKSLKTIQKAQSCARGKEWIYSKAFLHFWLKDFPKAFSECDRLEKKDFKDEDILVKQICEFNENLLQKFPDNIAIKYWLGFLYLVKLKNKPMAYKYFDQIKDVQNSLYTEIVERAANYLTGLKKEIGY